MIFFLILLGTALILFASSEWALVLSGGGARGAYEAGALKAIKEIGLNVKGVYGTSVGSLNGVFYVQGSVDELYKIWQNLSFESVMELPSTSSTNIFRLSLPKIYKVLLSGGFNVSPLAFLISKYLNEEKVRKSGIDFGLVTIDISNFTPLELYLSNIPKGKLLDYLMASANYPLFKRWKIGNNVYIDGGFYNNAPVDMALKKGFKRVLLVNVSDIPIFLPKIPKNVEFKVINPSGPIGSAMEFVPSQERIWEEMGYLDTMKFFGKFVGKRYYIYPSSKNILIDAMLKMNRKEIEKLANIIGVNVEVNSVDFAVYEKILPELLNYFPSSSFEELNLSVLEYAASFLNIPRLKAYTQYSLCQAITKAKIPKRPFWKSWKKKDLKIVEFVKEICENVESENKG